MDLQKTAKTDNFKQFVFKLLIDKYKYDEIIEKICYYLVTDNEYSQFSQLLLSLYDKGYNKAINDLKSQLEAMNIRVNINQKTL